MVLMGLGSSVSEQNMLCRHTRYTLVQEHRLHILPLGLSKVKATVPADGACERDTGGFTDMGLGLSATVSEPKGGSINVNKMRICA